MAPSHQPQMQFGALYQFHFHQMTFSHSIAVSSTWVFRRQGWKLFDIVFLFWRCEDVAVSWSRGSDDHIFSLLQGVKNAMREHSERIYHLQDV